MKLADRVNPSGVDLYELEYNTNMNKQAIPSRTDPKVIETFSKNRSNQRYYGSVQLGKLKERTELKDLLLNNDIINYLNSKGNGSVDASVIDVIDYIPNSRLAYYNKMIKMGLQSGLSPCDIDAVNNVWMSQDNIAKLKRLLTTMLDPQKTTFTILPSSRSGAIVTGKQIGRAHV